MAYPLLSSLLFLTISNNFPFISQCNFIKHKLDHVSFAPKSFSSFYTWNSLISCHICSFQRLQAGWAASAWRHLHMLFWLSEHSSREPSWGWFLNITLSLKSPLCSEKFLFFCVSFSTLLLVLKLTLKLQFSNLISLTVGITRVTF